MATAHGDGAVVAVRRIGRGRGHVIVVAWAAVLAVLVAIGAAGRHGDDLARADQAPGVASAPPPGATLPALVGHRILVLTRPALGATFSAGGLRVTGIRNDGGGAVRLAVTDQRGRALDVERIVVDRRFEAVLRVPNPPLSGTIWLDVTAFDADGRVVAAATRSLRVVPRVDDGAPPRAVGQPRATPSLEPS